MSSITSEYQSPKEITGNDLQKALEMMRDMMGEIHHEATIGANLNKFNISSEWAEGVKQILTSPVRSSYEALRSIEESIQEMIHGQFFEFLRSQAKLIDKAYKVSDNQLHYAIILRNHSFSNEAKIIDFKMKYDETPVSQKFPLIISFVELEELEGAKLQEELALG